jgi:spore coat polysaccharide biosynthesis protein SpsF
MPDYASNTLRRTYPRGLDTEVFTVAALECACREAAEPYQRAHVTPFLYQHPDRFRLLAVTGDEDYSGHRWTVDTAEDMALVRAIYARLGDRRIFSWRDALSVVSEEPDLAALNRNVRHKQLGEG